MPCQAPDHSSAPSQRTLAWLIVLGSMTVSLAGACTSGAGAAATASPMGASGPSVAAAAVKTAVNPAAKPEPGITEPGIEHYRRWSDHLGQGGQPQGEEGFATLQRLGFKTVLSVDGAAPDVEGAARHGLHYVHVPVGYDGISPDEQMKIVKAVRDSAGPVFVHCHHGLHRGPAAAAIARMGTEAVAPDVANAGLKESGCSPDYAGLYRDVLAFHAPDPASLAALPPVPSLVRPKGLRAAMVEVDNSWDLLKACKEAGWKTPAKHPDVVAAHQATILREQLHEAGRQDEASAHGADFLSHLAAAEKSVSALEAAAARDAAAADAAFGDIKRACASCHAIYRDKD